MHPTSGLFAVAHGRDQLHENWPERFDTLQGAELPAEAMYRVAQGANYGWPYCYYDGRLGGYFLAPEYGGDGRRTERCADKPKPAASFPAHWAPNALLFYTGVAFPERYRGGAFIAFHGSWNRPRQQGYNVVFVPMDLSGNATGNAEIFADGFAGATKTPEGVAHRPSGLAMGPDGALYISDDQRGRVWRVVRK
jgi:glucose/arabinose dehydrogenase